MTSLSLLILNYRIKKVNKNKNKKSLQGLNLVKILTYCTAKEIYNILFSK